MGVAPFLRAGRRWLAALGLALCAAAAPAPAAAQVMAPPDGSSLRVYLLTMGQGDAIWERFGHNALVIRDLRTGSGVAWNWGLFDFAAPDFLTRFLTGDTRYWMAGQDLEQTLEAYRRYNRSLWLQELALPDSVKAGLVVALAENAREDRKFYRYDYFRDNCSTRVRDWLDRATGGAVRAALEPASAATTYRRETERLLAGMPVAAFGVDIALGARADRELTLWDASFVPMTLRDAVRRVRVPDGQGGTRPLVTRDEPLFLSARPAEAVVPPQLSLPAALIGLGLATLLGLLVRAGGGAARGAFVAIGTAWSLAAGVVGVILLLAATVTRHDFWGANANLLLFPPLSLALVVLLPLSRRGPRVARIARGTAAGVALAAAGGGAVALATGQPIAITLALAMPVHALLYVGVRRITGDVA